MDDLYFLSPQFRPAAVFCLSGKNLIRIKIELSLRMRHEIMRYYIKEQSKGRRGENGGAEGGAQETMNKLTRTSSTLMQQKTKEKKNK